MTADQSSQEVRHVYPFEDQPLVEGEPTWERMGKLARICVEAVARHFSDELDYSVESIRSVDMLIISGWGPDERRGTVPLNVRLAFGAYVGEVLSRKTRGRWVSGLSDEEPATLLFLDENDEPIVSISPFALVSEKLDDPYGFDLGLAATVILQRLDELGAG
jgi:hypothetical protein